MDESLKGRAKSKKLRVRFPDGVEYCYSSSKETFLETLRKIGGVKLSRVKLEVCHLPMFSRDVYELYKDFMEPIGDGWYVNTQSDTYTKFLQLKVINEQLHLRLEIDMSEDFKGKRIHRGPKGMCVLEVTFPDHTVIGEENTAETFMQCIWHLGIDDVRKLHLQHSGKELITTAKLYEGQVQIDVDRWLVIPSALKGKVKILSVISIMLHIKMDITSFSTNEEKSYKRIGNKNRHKKIEEEKYKTKSLNSTVYKKSGKDIFDKKISNEENKFNTGDIVFHSFYGRGVVIEHVRGTHLYKVKFYDTFKDLAEKYQIREVLEDSLVKQRTQLPLKESIITKAVDKQKNSVISKKSYKSTRFKVRENDIHKTLNTEETSNVNKFEIGDIVYHNQYGKGIIKQYNEDSDTYVILFYNVTHLPFRIVSADSISEKA